LDHKPHRRTSWMLHLLLPATVPSLGPGETCHPGGSARGRWQFGVARVTRRWPSRRTTPDGGVPRPRAAAHGGPDTHSSAWLRCHRSVDLRCLRCCHCLDQRRPHRPQSSLL